MNDIYLPSSKCNQHLLLHGNEHAGAEMETLTEALSSKLSLSVSLGCLQRCRESIISSIRIPHNSRDSQRRRRRRRRSAKSAENQGGEENDVRYPPVRLAELAARKLGHATAALAVRCVRLMYLSFVSQHIGGLLASRAGASTAEAR